MRKKLINIFAPAAALLVTLGVASCEREDDHMEDNSISPKESAIYKHIADHKKERTRSGDDARIEEISTDDDSVSNN